MQRRSVECIEVRIKPKWVCDVFGGIFRSTDWAHSLRCQVTWTRMFILTFWMIHGSPSVDIFIMSMLLISPYFKMTAAKCTGLNPYVTGLIITLTIYHASSVLQNYLTSTIFKNLCENQHPQYLVDLHEQSSARGLNLLRRTFCGLLLNPFSRDYQEKRRS